MSAKDRVTISYCQRYERDVTLYHRLYWHEGLKHPIEVTQIEPVQRVSVSFPPNTHSRAIYLKSVSAIS